MSQGRPSNFLRWLCKADTHIMGLPAALEPKYGKMLRKAWLAGRSDLRAEIEKEDTIDAKIARKRLVEIDRNPKSLRRVDLKKFLGRKHGK